MAAKRDTLFRLGALMGATFMATCNNGGTTGEKTGQAAAKAGYVGEPAPPGADEPSAPRSSVQDIFTVTNNDTAPIRLSDLSIKFWVNETSANAIQTSVFDSGCVAEAGQSEPNCDHWVGATKMSVAASPQACAGEEANWVVSISTKDQSLLQPGETWSHIATGLYLPHQRAFTPGQTGWYSGCVGSSYAPSAHTALYYQGSLVHASTGTPPACVAPTGTQSVGGATAPGIVAGTYPLVAPLPPTTPMKVVISLPLTQQPGTPPLSDRISQMYDPTSIYYHQYMSATTFAAAYGPLQSDYDALKAFASANGLTVVDTYTSRSALGVTGTAAAVESALNVTMNQYKRPDGTIFYAPANDPSVNLTVPLLFIAGLDNLAVPRREQRRRHQLHRHDLPDPRLQPGPRGRDHRQRLRGRRFPEGLRPGRGPGLATGGRAPGVRHLLPHRHHQLRQRIRPQPLVPAVQLRHHPARPLRPHPHRAARPRRRRPRGDAEHRHGPLHGARRPGPRLLAERSPTPAPS